MSACSFGKGVTVVYILLYLAPFCYFVGFRMLLVSLVVFYELIFGMVCLNLVSIEIRTRFGA